MNNKYSFAPYDGKSDRKFNEALFRSLVSQYSDYTDIQNAKRVVRQFMPDSTLLGKNAGYSHTHSLATFEKNEVLALTCIVPFGEYGNLVSTMEVKEDYRGKGIGSELLCKAMGEKQPVSVYVSIHRPMVREFYAKNGFIEQEMTKTNLYGIEMIFCLMSCV